MRSCSRRRSRHAASPRRCKISVLRDGAVQEAGPEDDCRKTPLIILPPKRAPGPRDDRSARSGDQT